MKLKVLIGSGHKIIRSMLPFLVIGLAANVWRPSIFSVGGPPPALRAAAIVLLVLGGVLWLWSVALILTRVPRGELITTGPFALVKHPIYTFVSLLVLPWLGVLLNSWLGAVVGLVMYAAARRFAPEEEAELARTFGPAWDEYRRRVRLPWL